MEQKQDGRKNNGGARAGAGTKKTTDKRQQPGLWCSDQELIQVKEFLFKIRSVKV